MAAKIQSLLSSPWSYVFVLCPLLMGITCWRNLQWAADDPQTPPTPPALKTTLVSETADPRGKSVSSTTAEPQVESPPPELELLSKIRGEIGSPLDESLFHKDPDDGSADESFDATYRRESAALQAGESLLPARGTWRPKSIDPLARHHAALRNAARLLDEGAADLEESESYELADELRGWAIELREQARVKSDEPPVAE